MTENQISPLAFSVKGLSLQDVKYLRESLKFAADNHPGDPKAAEWRRLYADLGRQADSYCQEILFTRSTPVKRLNE